MCDRFVSGVRTIGLASEHHKINKFHNFKTIVSPVHRQSSTTVPAGTAIGGPADALHNSVGVESVTSYVLQESRHWRT